MFSVFFLKSFYLAIFHLWRHIARDFQLTYIYPTVLSVVLKIRTRSTWRTWTDSRVVNIFVQLFKYFCPCAEAGGWSQLMTPPCCSWRLATGWPGSSSPSFLSSFWVHIASFMVTGHQLLCAHCCGPVRTDSLPLLQSCQLSWSGFSFVRTHKLLPITFWI